MTYSNELREVWEEMEKIEPLTPIVKDKVSDVIMTKVIFDSHSPTAYSTKWR